MNSICIPRVSAHYNEVDVRDALNVGFDGEFVDRIDVRYTKDSHGTDFQVMFVHFLPKEGNEHTVEFFQRLEQNGEVRFYTGARNKKTGERYFWKIRKIINKETKPVDVPVRPGLMSEEDEALLNKKKLGTVKKELEEGEIDESEDNDEDDDEEGALE